MNKYGALKNQMDGMIRDIEELQGIIRDIEELQAENEKLKAENKKLKNYRVLVPKPIDHWGDGLLFVPEGFKQLYNDEEVEKIVKERDGLKVELRDRVDYIHEQDEVIKDYKHRAEVAEMALLLFCDKTMEKYLEIFFKSTNTHVRNKQELYDYYIKQAEKELLEKKKDE